MDDQQRNLIIAVAVSIAILLGFQYFLARPTPTHAPAQQHTAQTNNAPATATAPGAAVPSAPGAVPGATGAAVPVQAKSRAEILASQPRVTISTPRLHGSISLIGARVDDLTLVNYHETIDPKSPEIFLLSPDGTEHP